VKNLSKIGTCEKCLSYGRVSQHHKIKRSQQIALRDCKKNLIYLCDNCHYSIHHGNGHALDMELQLEFQNYLERILLKQYFTIEEIQSLLDIKYKDACKIVKTLNSINGKYYTREDIIRSAMGGKIIESVAENEL
jgi:hypothetical protein